jgi:hypothetical protein
MLRNRADALNEQFAELQKRGTALQKAWRRTHSDKQRLLIQLYLWWRQASQLDGYLEKLYSNAGIRWQNRRTNTPNFAPLIRAIFGVTEPDAADRVTISQDARAMLAMHRHYEQNSESFAHNPEGKLFNYIQENGGVNGLAATVEESSDDTGDRDRPRPRPHPDPDPGLPDIAPIALAAFAKQTDGIGTAQLEIDVRANDSEPFVALLRKHKGQIIVLGQTFEADQIGATASAVAREALPFLSPAFRALVETIKTQMFPSRALPSDEQARVKWLQSKFADPSDLQDAD